MANDNSYEKAKNKIDERSDAVRIPDMVLIPAGPFKMGTSIEQIAIMVETENWAEEWQMHDLFQVEQPQHEVNLPSFEIGRNPITNIEYFSFIYNSGHRVPKNWTGFHYNEGEAFHPVTGVSKDDTLAYCKWISSALKTEYRLPSEAEWEKAARGTDGRIYPWGDAFDPWRCNTLESAKKSTTPCGTYSPSGDSPYGVMDMVGNVYEWTSSFLLPYPFKIEVSPEDNNRKCIVRGGAWYYTQKLARCSARESVLPDFVSTSLGFRLARSASD